MRRLFNRVQGKRRGQRGFTLIELLVVVTILGVLAAVVVPTVARFAGQGATQAAATEKSDVQASIDAAMADNKLATVTDRTGAWVKDFSTANLIATGITLYPNYIRGSASTTQCYKWNTAGLITATEAIAAGVCP